MNRQLKRYPVLVGAIIVIVLVAAAIHLRQTRVEQINSIPVADPAPWALHMQPVVRSRLTRGFPVLATLSASREITISAQIAGAILDMGPREGVSVSRGEQLADIDVRELVEAHADLLAQLEAAKAEMERTRHEYQRHKKLLEKGAVSAEESEAKKTAAIAAKNRVLSLEREIAAKEVHIGYGTILSPSDGMISARLAEPGDTAQPGKALYRLTTDSGARVQVKVPQTILEQIHAGTPVNLLQGNEAMEVHVTRVFPSLDAQALGSAEADLEVNKFNLPSGARISARVVLEQLDDVLIIPHRALVGGTDHDGYVYTVIQDGQQRLKRVPVHVLLKAHEGIGIEAGLEPGQPVVVAHQSVLLRLRDGDPVITADRVAP